ncbi:acetolactate decarboxylase [Swaminathania salitolerans]|uniref:Alpha-acetolactate decarboxylase n=1 Tax=Swaminathania salitolerans TaxID=182838 RepID=A0A511BL72_9PROT|nr:acetolactate decarboxylase [Swaminathania salitolerans]GBQ09907.1 alpha-acetolactate decarboxylase [Swaminathania salitolerans LMG 21291]GEL01096.1 alpha-acetolactate decarboxylase [Swaminathania salitolerans]
MSRITQYSTVGALLAGHFAGEKSLAALRCEDAFGLGCSAGINGELTICCGRIYEASAGEEVRCLSTDEKMPFLQVTQFAPQQTHVVEDISHENAYEHIARHIAPDNIFLAVSIEGRFDRLVLRRPRRAGDETRDAHAVAASQEVETREGVTGRLVGFWTPGLFGRVSVPGFHFHFLDDARRISGHVLAYRCASATLSFEEKSTIEVVNPTSAAYRGLSIDLDTLDGVIEKIEK